MIRRLPHRASRVVLLAIATVGLTALVQQTTSTQSAGQPALSEQASVEKTLQRYGNRRNSSELQQFLRRGDIRPTPLTARGFDTDYHFMLMEIAGDELYFQTVSRLGETIDAGVITRKSARP